jgi:signal transduction histidine kinase/ActR/RegA family two-component response regulator
MAGSPNDPAEFRIVRPNGEVRWVLRETSVFRGGDGRPSRQVATIQDITERKKLEQEADKSRARMKVTKHRQLAARRAARERLHQSQKLEAVGRLTGGLAHDFNNLLAVVMGCAQLLQTHLKQNDSQATELVNSIARAAARGSDLTRSLLAFARRQPLAPKVVDANQLIADFVPLMRRTLREDVSIAARFSPGAAVALVDPHQLESVLLNLSLNARDATPEGGCITIETRNQVLAAPVSSIFGDVPAGTYVVVSVTDTGCGIPSENLPRVIEPFFTTKPPGTGSGLGLSSVYGFARQSGGHLAIESTVGVGTTVSLYLPCAAAPESSADGQASGPLADASLGGREAILLVEDDELVREAVLNMLQYLGYSVECASTGPAGLDILRSRKPDLLFTDVVLPGGLSGTQLAEEAKAICPGLKVLLASGYMELAGESGRPSLSGLPGMEVLQKPFSLDDLAGKLREALDRA